MSTLRTEDLAAALHRAVPEPVDVHDRAALVRRRAHRHRTLHAAVGSVGALVVALAVAVPALQPPGRDGSVGDRDIGTSGAPGAGDTAAILAPLRRPLVLPVLPVGGSCPVSGSRRFAPGGGFSQAFSGVGPGPVYLTGNGTVAFTLPSSVGSGYAGSDWGGQKVIWAVDRSYAGPLLIRGAQIDGDHGLRFDRYLGAVGYAGGAGDGKPYRELAYLGSRQDLLRTYPSALRLQAAGCYALQVDGVDFSEVIVFRARLAAGETRR